MSVGGADAVKLTQENLPAHNHAFSANTSSFDHGNKGTDWFDYGTKSTDVQELTSIHICNRITLMAMVPLAANLVCHHPLLRQHPRALILTLLLSVDIPIL